MNSRSRLPWRVIITGAILALAGRGGLPAQEAAAEAYPPQELWAPPDSCTILLDDFDSYEAGKRPPLWMPFGTDEQAKGLLTVEAADDARPDDLALVLTGPLQAGMKEMPVEAARWLPIPAVAQGVRLAVKGNSAGHDVHLRLLDSQDETFGYILGPVDSAEWVVRTVNLADTPFAYSFGRERNGQLDPPLRVQSVGVAFTPGGREDGRFRVLVDDLGVTIGETDYVLLWDPNYQRADDEIGLAMSAPAGTASGTLELVDDGELICPALSYDWGQDLPRPNSYLEVLFQAETGAAEGTLCLWVQGDGSRAYVTPRMADAEGECWQFQEAWALAVTWRGWRCVAMDISAERTSGYIEHWGGDGVLQAPLSFLSLLVDDLQPHNQVPDIETGERTGTIGFGPVYYVPWK